MLSSKDVAVVYETLLSSPGMSDAVKIGFQIPRKNVLLLSRIIELGLSAKENEQSGIIPIAEKETLSELEALKNEFLQKAGLTDMYNKLNALQSK